MEQELEKCVYSQLVYFYNEVGAFTSTKRNNLQSLQSSQLHPTCYYLNIIIKPLNRDTGHLKLVD